MTNSQFVVPFFCTMRFFYLSFLALALVLTSCGDDDTTTQIPVDFEKYTPPTWSELDGTPSSGLPQAQIDRWVALNPDFPLEESPSGLLYHILEEGTGAKPSGDNIVACFYRGMLVDGKVFDSSDRNTDRRAAIFAVNNLIAGFTEGIGLLGEGGRAIVLIRPSLGYGSSGSGADITPSTVLIFEMTMEEILD